MRLPFLGVISAITNHRNSNMYDSQPGFILEFRDLRQTLRKGSKSIAKFVIFHVCNMWSLKRTLAPIFVHVQSKRDPYSLDMLYRNFICWNQVKFFILSGILLLRESLFHIVNCLKYCNLTANCSLSTHSSCWGAPFDTFAHNFCFILKNMWLASELVKYGSRVVHQLFNKTMQKPSEKHYKRGPRHLWKRWGPRRPPCSPPLTSTPVLTYVQQKELASFYNTMEVTKVLCDVMKHIFRLFRHVTQHLLHWANNETALRYPQTHKINIKHSITMKQQLYSINLNKTV